MVVINVTGSMQIEVSRLDVVVVAMSDSLGRMVVVMTGVVPGVCRSSTDSVASAKVSAVATATSVDASAVVAAAKVTATEVAVTTSPVLVSTAMDVDASVSTDVDSAAVGTVN